jgi:hypothetical protein
MRVRRQFEKKREKVINYISGTTAGESHTRVPEYANQRTSDHQTLSLANNFPNILKPSPVLQSPPSAPSPPSLLSPKVLDLGR